MVTNEGAPAWPSPSSQSSSAASVRTASPIIRPSGSPSIARRARRFRRRAARSQGLSAAALRRAGLARLRRRRRTRWRSAGRRRWPSSTPTSSRPRNTIADRPRALKNALDYAYKEWNNKPVSFVGYGGVGGARAIEQLRLNAIELQMAPIRTAVHIQMPVYLAVLKEGKTLADFDVLQQNAKDMLDQLAWWTDALKAAREETAGAGARGSIPAGRRGLIASRLTA